MKNPGYFPKEYRGYYLILVTTIITAFSVVITDVFSIQKKILILGGCLVVCMSIISSILLKPEPQSEYTKRPSRICKVVENGRDVPGVFKMCNKVYIPPDDMKNI